MDLILLLINTCWVTSVTLLLGWCLYPKGFVSHSKIIDSILWLAIGNATLVLTGILLVRLNYPGKFVWYIIPVLLLYRLFIYFIPLKFYSISILPESWEAWSRRRYLKALISLFVLAMVVFYFPFIFNATSGYYAISGGDVSIYLRIADFFRQNGLFTPIPELVEFLPPYPNWNIFTYIKNIQIETIYRAFNLRDIFSEADWLLGILKGKFALQKGMGLLFASTLTSLPYLVMSFATVEEGYTISIFISFLLCIGGIAILLGYLFGKGDSFIVCAATTVTFSNVLLWMASSHATPALYVMGLACPLVLLAIIGLQDGRAPILAISILIACMVLVYFPFFLVGTAIPVCVYLFYSLAREIKKGWRNSRPYIFSLSFSLFAITLCVLFLTILEIKAPIHYLTFNNWPGPYFGLKGWHAFLAMTGSIDFDMLFPHALVFLQSLAINLGAPISLLLLFGLLAFVYQANWILRVIISCQILMLGYFCWVRLDGTHQYAGIRFAEIGSIYFSAAAGIGFLGLIIHNKNKVFQNIFKTCLASCLLVGLLLTSTLWARVLSWVPHEHSAMFDSKDLEMAASIEKIQKQDSEGSGSILYWFGAGPVSFAGSEVLFRNVRYFEAFDYDYINSIKVHPWWPNVELDILSSDYLEKAIFAFPYSWRKEIVSDFANFFSPPTWEFGKNKVYDTTSSSGFAFLGGAWNPPIPWQGEVWGRYLMGSKGNFLIWGTEPQKVKLEIMVTPLANNSGLKFTKHDGRLLKKVMLGKERESMTFSLEVLISPGINIIVVSPHELEKNKEWKLAQKEAGPWIAFTQIKIEKSHLLQ